MAEQTQNDRFEAILGRLDEIVKGMSVSPGKQISQGRSPEHAHPSDRVHPMTVKDEIPNGTDYDKRASAVEKALFGGDLSALSKGMDEKLAVLKKALAGQSLEPGELEIFKAMQAEPDEAKKAYMAALKKACEDEGKKKDKDEDLAKAIQAQAALQRQAQQSVDVSPFLAAQQAQITAALSGFGDSIAKSVGGQLGAINEQISQLTEFNKLQGEFGFQLGNMVKSISERLSALEGQPLHGGQAVGFAKGLPQGQFGAPLQLIPGGQAPGAPQMPGQIGGVQLPDGTVVTNDMVKSVLEGMAMSGKCDVYDVVRYEADGALPGHVINELAKSISAAQHAAGAR